MNELIHTVTWSSIGASILLWFGFLSVLFVGSMLIPGRRVQGSASPSGERPVYTVNGLALFLAVVSVVALGQLLGLFSLSALHRHIVPLFLVANVFAFILSVVLCLLGRRSPKSMSDASGAAATWRDWFFGVEFNPTWLGLELKLFSYRPSLIGLALINASFAAVQFETYGNLSAGMILYQVFTFLYVFNYFQFEYGMVHTWDMIAERFGWMLIWGDYVLVPFFYSIAGWFLVHDTNPLPPWSVVGLSVLFAFGFWLFRGANEQKHRFKMNPSTRIWGQPAKALDGRLLVSGFWGIGRHLNYSGEICIYLAFTLTTGAASWIPYLLPAWLMVLLLHRAWRDEQRCRAKYGPLWERYVERARFRMLPLVY